MGPVEVLKAPRKGCADGVSSSLLNDDFGTGRGYAFSPDIFWTFEWKMAGFDAFCRLLLRYNYMHVDTQKGLVRSWIVAIGSRV